LFEQELLEQIRQKLVVLGLAESPVNRLDARRGLGRHLVTDMARGAIPDS
jgi:hypothetical protein